MRETPRAAVLNADGDAARRGAVTRTLERAGYAVAEAETGAEALGLLLGSPLPSLAIVGAHLPDMAGSDLARRAKSDPIMARVPLLLVLASPADSESLTRALESGAEALLTEPVEAQVLLAQVSTLVRMRRLQQEVAHARAQANQRGEQLQTSEEGLASMVEELNVSNDELRAAIEALRASRDDLARQQGLLQSVIDGAPGPVWVKDREGRFLFTNRQFEKLRGASREWIRGRTEGDFLPPYQAAAHRAQERRVLETGVPELTEEVVPLGDGRHVLLVTTFPLYDAEGRPCATGSISTDITAQGQAEAALQESTERYRELFGNMSEGFALFDRVTRGSDRPAEWRYLAVNPAYEAMIGLQASELIGKLLSEALPGVEDRWLAALNRVARSGDPETVEAFLSPLGRWYRTSFHSPRLGHVAAIITDVTNQRRAEEALEQLTTELEARVAAQTAELRESEERFRAFVTATSDVVYRMSPDWSEMRYLRGRDFLPDTERPSRTWLEEYIHPDDREQVLAAIQEAIRTKSTFQLEHRVVRVDGTVGWTFSRAIPLLDANGEIVEWFGTASDITARKAAEEALRQLTRESP